MIKYYIIDEATSEQQETNKDDFISSLIYNLDNACDYADITTYQALIELKNCYDSIANKKEFETLANGFAYVIEV